MLTRRDCPEFQRGKAEGSRLKAIEWNNEDRILLADGVGLYPATGQRGMLTLDLDPSSVAEPLRRVDLNHDLDRSGPARTVKGNPSESGSDFVPQPTGDEWVMPQDCPEIGGGELGSPAMGMADEGWEGSFVPDGTGAAGFDQPTVGNGGLWSVVPTGLQWRARLRLRPPQWLCPPSAVGLLRPSSAVGLLRRMERTGYGGWTAPYLKLRNIQNRLFGFERKHRNVNVIGKREERKKTGYPRISGADGRTPLPVARGVKAPEGWRSPRPGGLRGGPKHGEHRWELRQRVCEADRAVVRMRRMPKSGCGFVLHDIGGEMLTRRGCPEIARGTVVAAPGLASGGVAPPHTLSARDKDAGTPAGVLAPRGWVSGYRFAQPPASSWEASNFLKPIPQAGLRPAPFSIARISENFVVRSGAQRPLLALDFCPGCERLARVVA